MKLLDAFLSFRRTYLQSDGEGALVNLLKLKGFYQWIGTVIQLAELIYALDEYFDRAKLPITMNNRTPEEVLSVQN